MDQLLLFEIDELDQISFGVGAHTEDSDCEMQKYFRHLYELREKHRIQAHLDDFNHNPDTKTLRRKQRRAKQKQEWNAFCDAVRPCDGFIEIPIHVAMQQFPDTDEVLYYRSRYYQEQVMLQNHTIMQRLQEHKAKIGFFRGKQYHFS